MAAPRALQPYRLSPEDMEAPLLFDLFNSRGTLLLKKGTRLGRDTDFLLTQSLFRTHADSESDEGGALLRLESMYRRYGRLMEIWSCRAEDVQQLNLVAADLVELCASHSDICVSMAAHLPGKSHATRHCFAAAIVAILLGNALGWGSKRQNTLALAAFTMNLSLLAYHDDWAKNRSRLSGFQRGNVHRHPGLSAELISQSPGSALSWITAVDQHHENLDGSGYPLGLKGSDISPEARVLRVADAWCALILLRSGRCRKSPRDALVELSESSRGHLDHQVFQALKRLMGAYPPGTFVRLANRETAIVTRWERYGALPKYALSILSPSGQLTREHKSRDVTQFGYAIREYTHLDISQMAQFSWSRIWVSEAGQGQFAIT